MKWLPWGDFIFLLLYRSPFWDLGFGIYAMAIRGKGKGMGKSVGLGLGLEKES